MKPAGRDAEWDAFLMPFSPRLWLVLLATILFIAFYLSTFYSIGRWVGNEESGGPELYTFYDSILYIFGAFCQQGHDLTPRSTSCRLVYITAYLTALVLLAAYSAALISSLTVYRSNLPFQDLEGILRDKTYKLGVVNMSEIYYTVSDPTDKDIFHEVYSKLMLPDQDNFPRTVLQGLKRICNIRYAFMSIPESVMPLLNQMNCTIVPLAYNTYPISLAMAFSPRSPYTDFWSYRLRMLRDGGVIYRLRTDSWPYLGQDMTKSTTVGVDLKAVAPLLALLSASTVMSVVILFLERGRFSVSDRRSRGRTRRERNASRQQMVIMHAAPEKPSIVPLRPGGRKD
ncbi:glutamate receptor ionotropic, delta-2-like [Zootermopsis nevadensis]|nr:glutamate receptor ionotropic, delta-2-like [Zootermopsis nevadensis]